MDLQALKLALYAYYQRTVSPAEEEALMSFLANPANKELVMKAMNELWDAFEVNADAAVDARQKILEDILYKADDPDTVKTSRILPINTWMRWAAAAVILALGIGVYFWTSYKKNIDHAAVAVHNADIQPGKQGAILTLANGTQIVLDSLGNGVIATQNGAQVLLQNGRLTYDPTGTAGKDVMYNTMTTPKGRQFHLVLPDGTKVWLNAASSIRYPTTFASSERKVAITGEAYFEVARNAQMPFHVNVNNKAEVEVLGTHFNVNAYDNEERITATLLEGSVRVIQLPAGQKTAPGSNVPSHIVPSGPPVTLKPGQQAQIQVGQKAQPGIKLIEDTDMEKVMAWKNGLFNFEDISFEEAMHQLERWYDIDVVYEHGVPDDIELNGEITKGVTLNDLLIVLEKVGMKCRLEGRRLIVEK